MTEHLREKINLLRQMLLNDAVELFSQNLQMQDAEATTGDADVDRELRSLASNAKAQTLRLSRRIAVRSAWLKQLEDELAAQETEMLAVPAAPAAQGAQTL